MAGNKHTEEINALLERISRHRARAAKIKEAVDRDIEALKEKYAGDLTSETSHAEAAEKELTTYLKKHKSEVFSSGDRVDLRCGAVLRHVKESVRKAKGITVELLKKLGYGEGVRVEESVNWDAISQWNSDRLTAIGTERKEKEDYSYELKADKAS